MSKFSSMNDEYKPREKFKLVGETSLSEIDLLAIILQSGSREDSVMALSQKLLEKYNGLSNLLDIEYGELITNKGIGDAKALKIRSISAICKRIDKNNNILKEVISTPSQIYQLCNDICNHTQEHFVVVFLDNKSRLIERKILYLGTSCEISISPKEVFAEAIHKRSHFIIIVHNHPSGDITPSKEDIETTKKIVEIGKIVGVTVLDHIIVTSDKYFSIRHVNEEIF